MSSIGGADASASRKRKLPAFVAAGGRALGQPAASSGSRSAAPHPKRQANESSVRRRSTGTAEAQPSLSLSPSPSPSPSATATPASARSLGSSASAGASTRLLSPPSIDLSRSPSPSVSPPALIPLHDTDAAAAASHRAASLGPPLHIAGSTSAVAGPQRVQMTGASGSIAPVAVARLPSPFDPAAASRPFPLLHLPADVLSLLSAWMTPWDAFFLRCTCSTLRLVSGLNGGATGPPRLLAPRNGTATSKRRSQLDRRSSAPVSAAATSDTAEGAAEEKDEEGEEWSDPHRFWHHYTSLDFRQILCGWRTFEQHRTRLIHEQATRDDSPTPLTDLLSAASPVANTITLFDSDDEVQPQLLSPADQRVDDSDVEMEANGVQLRHARTGSLGFPAVAASASSASASSARSPSPPLSSEWQINIYDRLQRVVSPYALGCPRIRPSALASGAHASALSSRGAPEDHSSSSEEDVWILQFLKTHRFPSISFLHFAYITLHSPLLHHLQAFCCAPHAESSEGLTYAATEGVREVSVQFSEKSIGRWMDTALTGFGPLHTVSLDLTPCKQSIWRTIAPLLPPLASSLTHLQIAGPTIAAASLPANILDILSSSLPELRVLLAAHGLATTQSHLAQVCDRICTARRWPRLASLTLLHFPLIEHLLPLVGAFATHGVLATLDVQNCINLRLPVIELPKKQKPAAASAKGKRPAARADSPPPAKSPPSKPPSADMVLSHTAVPSLPLLHTCTVSQCASLTVPSLRSLSLLFPCLHTLRLDAYDSMMGGSALKLLMDSSLFPSLTALHLSRCPQLDDHAWEALPKKTRMTKLRLLDLSLARSAASNGPAIERGKMGVGGRNVHSNAAAATKKKFTDQGLNMLLVYCPSLSALHLSGQVHLSLLALLRVFTRLPCIRHVALAHMAQLDAGWLQSLVRLPVAHAFSVRVSLSIALIHTAPTLLPSLAALLPSQSAASLASPAASGETATAGAGSPSSSASGSPPSSSPPPPLRRAPSKLTSTSINGSILRTKLAEQLQMHVAAVTQRRVTLQVQL